MHVVPIYVTPMSFRFHLQPDGLVRGTALNVGSLFHDLIHEAFNPRLRIWEVRRKYRYYNSLHEMIYLPRYNLDKFVAYLTENGYGHRIVNIPAVQGALADVELIPSFKPKDERQDRAINHLIHNTEPVRGLAIQTGGGKTAAGIAGIAGLKRRTMINMVGMSTQWYDAIKEYSLTTDDEIYVIEGAPSLAKLLARIDKTIHPKIIIASIRTLAGWALDKSTFDGYPQFDRICELLNVGVSIVDEAHLNFYASYIMMLRMNPSIIIPMTATYDVSIPSVKKIYDRFFPQYVRFGEEEYVKYVDVYSVGYNTGWNDTPVAKFKGPEGYSHAKFENWLLKHDGMKAEYIYNTVYHPLIASHYFNIREENEKLLILCTSIEMCKWIANRLKSDRPDLSISVYAGEKDDADLVTSDVIVSTPFSAGTGRDIKRLRTVIDTISRRSGPLNIQILGRLRELKYSDVPPRFVYVHHLGIPQHADHNRVRLDLYRPKALSLTEYTV